MVWPCERWKVRNHTYETYEYIVSSPDLEPPESPETPHLRASEVAHTFTVYPIYIYIYDPNDI